MKWRIAVLGGDGVGPEVTLAALRSLVGPDTPATFTLYGDPGQLAGAGNVVPITVEVTERRNVVTEAIADIEFVKGPDRTAPVVMAVTVETP